MVVGRSFLGGLQQHEFISAGSQAIKSDAAAVCRLVILPHERHRHSAADENPTLTDVVLIVDFDKLRFVGG